MNDSLYKKGLEGLEEVGGELGKNSIGILNEIAPDVGKYAVELAYGDIHGRSGLSQQEKEMVTLAALLAQGGCERQLEVHINGALNVGAPAGKIIETFIQCIPYTGFPKVVNAITVARKVFAERHVKPGNQA